MKTRIKALSLMTVVVCAGMQGQAMGGGSLLGAAEGFAVLGGSTVTNVGPSIVTGDLGVWPGTSITGFPPGTLNGVLYAGGPVPMQAQGDLTSAYNALAAMPIDVILSGVNLGGMTLTPGVYFFATSAQLTGTLTLDFQGDANALFVFQIGTTLTTATGAAVQAVNGGDSSNVFWQIGSSATLGTGTAMRGNILAHTSITFITGATILDGRALALNGAVTLGSNILGVPSSPPSCPAFNDLAAFQSYNQVNGQTVEGFEDFEAPVSNVPAGAVALIHDPLWNGTENVDGSGLGFPDGLATIILVMQSNALGADAQQTLWGGGLAVFGVNSAAAPPECPADCDGDEIVGINDLLALLQAWGACAGCCQDLNGDGPVGIADLTELLGSWGFCPASGPGSPDSVAVGATLTADSTDVLFQSGLDNHTGVGLTVFDPNAQPGGTIHIAVFTAENLLIASADLPSSMAPQFWGISSVPCGVMIRRINVAALSPTGAPSQELVDDVRTWQQP